MKRIGLTVVAASLLAIVGLWPAAQAGKVHNKVVCITRWGPHPKGSYRYRPHACDFHDRRGSDYIHAEIQATRHLRWRYWSPHRASARGKIGISTYGFAPVRVKLSQPRPHCGHRVFTKGRFKVRIRVRGGHRTYRYTVPLDACTP